MSSGSHGDGDNGAVWTISSYEDAKDLPLKDEDDIEDDEEADSESEDELEDPILEEEEEEVAQDFYAKENELILQELRDPFGDQHAPVERIAAQAKARKRTRTRTPDKVTLPSLVLDKDMPSDILRDFYQSATQEITLPLPLPLHQNENDRGVLRILKEAPKPSPEFLMFVPIEEAEKKSHLIMRAKDLYKVGYEIEGHHYILDFERVSDGDDVLEALLTLGIDGRHTSDVGVYVDYPNLEALIQKQRHDLELGRGSLLKHFRLLFVEDLHRDHLLVAQVVLFFTQIICEALRIYEMRNHILSSFLEGQDNIGVKTPLNLVILQHGWATASNRLQRAAMGIDGFEVRIDVNGAVIGVPLLFTMFTCLRRYGRGYLQNNLNLPEEDKVMALKYALTENSRKMKLRAAH